MQQTSIICRDSFDTAKEYNPLVYLILESNLILSWYTKLTHPFHHFSRKKKQAEEIKNAPACFLFIFFLSAKADHFQKATTRSPCAGISGFLRKLLYDKRIREHKELVRRPFLLTSMLFTFAPNSTLFTSLPLTIGLTYGLLMLTILFGILSL